MSCIYMSYIAYIPTSVIAAAVRLGHYDSNCWSITIVIARASRRVVIVPIYPSPLKNDKR